MNTITLHMGDNADYTLVSNIFIDTYMPSANGEFVKVYLYLLKCVSANQAQLSVSAMADLFNQTENDIIRAVRYWEKTGVLHAEWDSAGSLRGISFPALSTAAKYESFAKPEPLAESEHLAKSEPAAAFTPAPKTSYSPLQIQELSSQEDFKMLLGLVGAYLGTTLTATDIQTLAYIYDSLNFSFDLIDFLVEYCVSKGHKNMRYIEKVALNWAELNITTVKEAKQFTSNNNTIVYSIMNAFGISNRDPGQRERDFIKKWTDVYCFDADIIIEACNRTLRATHQPSFEYADSILSKWNSANVKTAADIRRSDAEYELLRSKTNAQAASSARTATTNRFNNFHQRDTDIDSLERALISNNM